jgi:LacI family transcriptional regulator
MNSAKKAPFDSRSLARLCGVSRGTVDRALHGRGEVNAKTRQKILDLAEKHGYRPNALGQALVTGKTHTLGLIAFDLENSFFTELISAAEKRARERGYTLLMALSQKDPSQEGACLDFMTQKRVDGLALIPVATGKAFTSRLASLPFPLVSFGNRLASSVPFAGIDEFRAMAAAVDHAVAMKYRRLLYFCPPMRHLGKVNLDAQERRLSGYHAAVKRHHLKPWVLSDSGALESQWPALRSLEGKGVVLCANDFFALEVMERARAAGLRAPEDFGLVGFDGLSFLKYVRPSLSTVAYPTREVGVACVDMLLDLISTGRCADQILSHHLQIGQTTGGTQESP